MNKLYQSPETEIEKFSVSDSILTLSYLDGSVNNNGNEGDMTGGSPSGTSLDYDGEF
jgi:hypothetical protein